MKRQTRCAGFTLMEMIVVISLMGLVTTLGLSVFFKMSDAWYTTSVRTAMDRSAAKAFESIRNDVAHIVSPSLVGVPMSGMDGTTRDDERFYGIALGDDAVAFPVLAPTQPDGAELAAVVKYYVKRGEGQESLVRAVGGAETELTPGVVWLDVEYAAPDGLWQHEWNSDKLPKAMRVSLTLLNPDSPTQTTEQIVRKAVFPLYVN